MATHTKTTTLSLVGGLVYKWTNSAADADEYYLEAFAGGDPGLAAEPDSVSEDGVALTPGTAGLLVASEWDWADNDTLGFSTIYIRTAGDVAPGTLADNAITARVSTSETVDRTRLPGAPQDFSGGLVVPTTIATGDFSVNIPANPGRVGLQIDQDTGADVYYVESDTQPSNINQMTKLADGENYFNYERVTTGKIYLYQASGGPLDVGVRELT